MKIIGSQVKSSQPLEKIVFLSKNVIFLFSLKDLSAKMTNVLVQQSTKHRQDQGTLKGEVSLYRWPPVWLVGNQLYENWQFLFLFAKQTNPNRSNRRSTVQWYFPFSVPWQDIKIDKSKLKPVSRFQLMCACRVVLA